jgi:hypothetical protein
MNKMIRMATMAAAMCLAVSAVSKAQDQQGKRPMGGSGRIMAVLDSVKASDAIKAKADSIIKANQAINAPLMEAMRGGDSTARAKLMENNKKQNDAIKALLSDEQKAQFDKVMAAMPQGGRRPPTR